MGLFNNEYDRIPLGYDAYAVAERNRRAADAGQMGRSPILDESVPRDSRLVIRSNVPGNVSYQIVRAQDGGLLVDDVSNAQTPILLDDQDRVYEMRLVSKAYIRRPIFLVGVAALIGFGIYRYRAKR